MNKGNGNGSGCFEIEDGLYAIKVKNGARARKVGDVNWKWEMYIDSNAKITERWLRGEREEKIADRWFRESGIFLICSDW